MNSQLGAVADASEDVYADTSFDDDSERAYFQRVMAEKQLEEDEKDILLR